MNESRNRPYAPPSNVVELFRRLRTRNVPQVINREYLRAAGFSAAIAPRVLQTIEFLGLVDDAGEPHDALRSLARSSDEDYRQILEGILRESYREVFEAIDPAQDTQDAIVGAFQRYEPGSQHYRMAILFSGLCREAGIPVLDEPRKRKVQKGKPTARGSVSVRSGKITSKRAPAPSDAPAQGSAVLWGYFQRLPKPGSVFSERDRDAWVEGMRGAFGLEYQAEPEIPEEPEGGEAAE